MSIEQFLEQIEQRLCRIEELILAPSKSEALSRNVYSVAEAAELTEAYGIKQYAAYTIRRACAGRRIPDATKLDDGKTWALPKEALLRILENGLPPERR